MAPENDSDSDSGPTDAPEDAPPPTPSPAAVRPASVDDFDDFPGDKWNGPGLRCGYCGVVVTDGDEIDAHRATHDEG